MSDLKQQQIKNSNWFKFNERFSAAKLDIGQAAADESLNDIARSYRR